MAKLTAPLMSFGASGKLADALVYFPWKGVDSVRSYVIPANPRTALQMVQRAYLTAAVSNWHAETPTAADLVAYNRWANVLAGALSGFNAYIRANIAFRRAGETLWGIVSNVQINTPTAVGFDVDVENSVVGYTLRCRIGTTRTFLPTIVALVDDGDGTYSLTWAAGVASQDYYVQIDKQEGGVWYTHTGIYLVRTTA